jgi:hypothetical protein
MKIKFIVEKGTPSTDSGTVNIEKIKINNPVKIFYDFDNSKLIGLGNVFKEDNVLTCEADINEKDFDKYPAIGYKTDVENQELYCIGLCSQRNVDETILKLSDQIGTMK